MLWTPAARPPGPRSALPGGLLFPFRRDPLAFLTGLAQAYGPASAFSIGPQAIYFFDDPAVTRDVLVTHQRAFIKGGALQRAKGVLGEGLLTSEGDRHVRQRRLAQPAFHRPRVAAYADVMAASASRVADAWAPGPIDAYGEMMQLALSVVGATLFGADVEGEAGEVAEAIEAMLGWFDTVTLPFSRLWQALPTASNRRARAALARLDAIIYRLITERRAAGRDRGDLLSMLLMATDPEAEATPARGNAPDGMSDRQVRDEAMTIFLAGHETTATAMAWTWYLLARHPEVEARLHTELADVLGGCAPTNEDLPRLPLLDRIFREALRLFPPGWAIGRRAIAPVSLAGYAIPEGAIVLLSPYVSHRNASYFPDPEAFLPDRWLEPPPPAFAYFPFGGGARGCIGEHFARMEAMLAVATIAQAWRLRLAPGYTLALQPMITLRPRGGLPMIAERRG